MKEIRYAALLHDFGKVGVREEVLVKAKKLYPMQIDIVAHRFDYLYKEMEASMEREKVRLLLEMDRAEALRAHRIPGTRNIASAGSQMEERIRSHPVRRTSRRCCPTGSSTACSRSPGRPIAIRAASSGPCSRRRKCASFPFRKGASMPDERAQIESHVVHSFNFLLADSVDQARSAKFRESPARITKN